jgi:D-threo-aldose 1-dehydrogenase
VKQNQRVKLRTGIEISKFGLGTAAFGGLYQGVSMQDCQKTTATALEHGITFIDTAPHYGKGVSETRLGEILKSHYRDALQISSKVGRILENTEYETDEFFKDSDTSKTRVYDYSAAGIDRSIKDSLERLQIDYLDIVFIHDPEGNEDTAISEGARALSKLRDSGYIKAYGVGMNSTATPTRFIKETDVDMVLIAGRFSILDQSAKEDLLPAALDKNVDIIAAGVFNSGLLANPKTGSTYDYLPASNELLKKVLDIQNLAREYGMSLKAAAIQFPLKHPAVKAVLVGCRSKEEVEENVHAFNEEIPEEFWSEMGL